MVSWCSPYHEAREVNISQKCYTYDMTSMGKIMEWVVSVQVCNHRNIVPQFRNNLLIDFDGIMICDSIRRQCIEFTQVHRLLYFIQTDDSVRCLVGDFFFFSTRKGRRSWSSFQHGFFSTLVVFQGSSDSDLRQQKNVVGKLSIHSAIRSEK